MKLSSIVRHVWMMKGLFEVSQISLYLKLQELLEQI